MSDERLRFRIDSHAKSPGARGVRYAPHIAAGEEPRTTSR